MPTSAIAVRPRARTLPEWRRWEQVGLKPTLELDELVLNWINRQSTDLDVLGALTSVTIERTIEGGSTITLVVADPDGRLFSRRARRTSKLADPRTRKGRAAYRREPTLVDEAWEPILPPDIIGGAVEVELDGVVFRLVKVRYSTTTQQATLVFEDRVVYLLKRKHGAKRADRADCTRAEFMLTLLREVQAGRYRFVCPELTTRQPIETAPRAARVSLLKTTTSSSSSHDDDTRGGFAPNARLTVKGVKATREQQRNLDAVLAECVAQGCSTDVMVATVCCVTQESVARILSFGDAAGPDSRGLFQQRAPWGPLSVRMDATLSTRMFLTGGRGGQSGYRQANGDLTRVPGGIEAAVKKVQVSVGGYAQWQQEAQRTVSAWRGSDEGSAALDTGYRTKSYQYARNTDETSWVAMQRLATEVGWRLFVVGNSVYFMSEQQLYARRSRYELTPDDPAILDLSYDVDWGKPVSEMTLDVALDRWGAPPGSVVSVDGYGPPDGRWLVVSVTRDYFQPTATVTLRQPGKEKLEPAAERVQRASNATGSSGTVATGTGKVDDLYRECKRINDAAGPYVYGGGHGPALSSMHSGSDMDCSSSCSLALYRAGMFPDQVAMVSGTFAARWGQPGRGQDFTVWASVSHVFIEFERAIGGSVGFNTSPRVAPNGGPRLRSERASTVGMTPRHWPGS